MSTRSIDETPLSAPPSATVEAATRLDVSVHDASRLAWYAIIDVPRNSVVDLRARLRWKEGAERIDATPLLNKTGLVRAEAAPQVHMDLGRSVTQ
jgi:hypothetical protein